MKSNEQNHKMQGMTRKIWPYHEAQTHWEEIMQLAAGGEPQQVTRPDGVTLVIQMELRAPKPFTPVLAAFEGLPRDGELAMERSRDVPKDREL